MSKKQKGTPWIEPVMITLGLAALVFVVIQIGFFDTTKTTRITTKKYEVKYMITCDNCNVTYTTPSGTEQQTNVNSDWTYVYEGKRGDTPYISAQNQNETGTVKVAIFINGKMAKHSQSEGQYVIATADGYIQ